MTRAYSRGSTLLVANLQYSGIVFAAFYSPLLFGDQIPPIGWAGMGVIVASGLAATVLRTRTLPIPRQKNTEPDMLNPRTELHALKETRLCTPP